MASSTRGRSQAIALKSPRGTQPQGPPKEEGHQPTNHLMLGRNSSHIDPVWPRIYVLGLLPYPYTSQRTTSIYWHTVLW